MVRAVLLELGFADFNVHMEVPGVLVQRQILIWGLWWYLRYFTSPRLPSAAAALTWNGNILDDVGC